MLVCHSCDNQSCVRPSHLFLGTPLDNMLDMCAKDRTNPKRKIPKDAIGEIQARVAHGEIPAHIAKEFGVTKEAIYYHLDKARRLKVSPSALA
jgi:hypothetical protein